MENSAATRRLPDGDSILAAIGFVLLINVVGGLPGVLSSPDSAWFRALEKPAVYPPEIAFPIVWTALFTLMGVSLWLVWRADGQFRTLAAERLTRHSGGSISLGSLSPQPCL